MNATMKRKTIVKLSKAKALLGKVNCVLEATIFFLFVHLQIYNRFVK